MSLLDSYLQIGSPLHKKLESSEQEEAVEKRVTRSSTRKVRFVQTPESKKTNRALRRLSGTSYNPIADRALKEMEGGKCGERLRRRIFQEDIVV